MPPKKKTRKKKTGRPVTTGPRKVRHIRLFDTEWFFIKAAADRIGMPPTTFIRLAALARAKEVLATTGLLDAVPPPDPPEIRDQTPQSPIGDSPPRGTHPTRTKEGQQWSSQPSHPVTTI